MTDSNGAAPGLSDTAAADERSDGRLPVALGQEQLWFLDAMSPGNPAYNVCHAYSLTGEIDADVLDRALAFLLDRHDALRATFDADAGVPYQQLHDPATRILNELDFTDLAYDTRSQAIEKALLAEVETPFELRSGPLYRFALLRTGSREHVLCFSFHHIVTDGWSTGIFYSELSEVYQAFLNGTEPDLEPLSCRYVDFARSQRDEQESIAKQMRYWEERLAGLQPLDLPTDRARPAPRTYRGDRTCMDFSPELLAAARAAAQRQRVSLLMLLASGVTAVLARQTGQDDIPLGVSMLGRPEMEHERLVGLFINMVVLRSDLSADPTMAELVDDTQDAIFDAFDHQGVPFGAVVERVQPLRQAGRNPLFDVGLQLLGDANSGTNLKLPGIATEPVRVPFTHTRFDLTLNFVESADSLRLDAEYSTELFDRDRVKAFLGHVTRTVEAICADPSVRLSRLPLLPDEERERLLAAGRGEPGGQPPGAVHEAVARTAAANPDAIAAICRGRSLSYGELDRRAAALARYLSSRGVGHEQIIAIAMHRDVDALVALLGVMKAGAAYTVLDPAHPAARMEFMLRDTAAPLLLTTSHLTDQLPRPDGWQVVELDRQWAEIESAAADSADATHEVRATGDSLVYVLYTSGSSGKPKGVLLEHRGLLSFARQYGHVFDLHPGDRMLQLSALSFDMSHGEIFAGLVAGATLILVPQEGGTPDALAELMRAEKCTFISMSPAMLALVEPGPYPHLEKMQAGGDVLPGEVAAKWTAPGRRVINVYGPTEASVACTGYECPDGVTWRGSPPIGRPFLDRRLYVVDRWGNLAPKGVPGELLIGGDEGVGRGYLNQPELTAQRFTEDPFHPGGRVYHSGDLVRWTQDWQIQFLGRIDAQVQVNGLRIELEEIETALLAHPLVGLAAVAPRPDPRGEMRLVGYVAPAGDQRPDIAELRRHLVTTLPDYMVPSAWMILDELPLTTARKVDRKALPAPDAPVSEDDGADLDFEPPATETEKRVADAFAEVLGRRRIAAADSFFDLGGSSMQAMRTVSRLNKAFGIRLNVRSLYGVGTVSSIAMKIDDMLAEARRPMDAAQGAS